MWMSAVFSLQVQRALGRHQRIAVAEIFEANGYAGSRPLS